LWNGGSTGATEPTPAPADLDDGGSDGQQRDELLRATLDAMRNNRELQQQIAELQRQIDELRRSREQPTQ
jgi:uncharacterized protein YhaN